MVSWEFLPAVNPDCDKALINSLCPVHQDPKAGDTDLGQADIRKGNGLLELKLHQTVQKVFTVFTICLEMLVGTPSGQSRFLSFLFCVNLMK